MAQFGGIKPQAPNNLTNIILYDKLQPQHMTKIISIIIPIIIGSVIMVNGVMIKSSNALASARIAANQVNVHELDNALEFYYFDHNQYPPVSGGEALAQILFDGGYIRNKPMDSSEINYEPKDNNQNYSLGVLGLAE